MKSKDDEIIISLQNDIEILRKFNIESNDFEIKLDSGRWIGDGSGIINNSIRFYLDKGKVFYIPTDADLLNKFNEMELELKIFELIEKQRQIQQIMNSYYKDELEFS